MKKYCYIGILVLIYSCSPKFALVDQSNGDINTYKVKYKKAHNRVLKLKLVKQDTISPVQGMTILDSSTKTNEDGKSVSQVLYADDQGEKIIGETQTDISNAQEIYMQGTSLIVVLKEGSSFENLENRFDSNLVTTFRNLGDDRVFKMDININTVEEYNSLLRRLPDGIQKVEPNYFADLGSDPNDPYYTFYQWALNNTGQSGGLFDADVDALEAWELTTGNDIVIGVIDTGIDYGHVDLVQNIYVNPNEIPNNGIDDDNNGYIDDYRGWDFYSNDKDPSDEQTHGTHVAGIIGASGNNALGVTGVNWNVKLVPLKVFGGPGQNAPYSAVIEAINYSSKITNLLATNNSYGSYSYSQGMELAIENANDNNKLFIASAGNDGINVDVTPHYPSSYSFQNVISVANSTRWDQLATSSNFGPASVDLAAPGDAIFSTIPGNSYGYKSGTSMAAPFVTGTCALIKSLYPSSTIFAVKERIVSSVDKKAFFLNRVSSNGRLNVYNSLIPPPSSQEFVPVGSIIAYRGDVLNIPENWAICEGQDIDDPDSPLYGQKAPNLTDGRFLMGTTSDAELFVSGDYTPKSTTRNPAGPRIFDRNSSGPPLSGVSVHDHPIREIRPNWFGVLYLIKIK